MPAKKASAIPNFRDVRTKRALITGALATAIGVVAVVPLYNNVLAPAVSKVTTSLRTAGFLPSA